MSKHHLILVGAAAALFGFVLANAQSGTGIYSTPVGNTLASIYTFGATKAGVASTTPTAT